MRINSPEGIIGLCDSLCDAKQLPPTQGQEELKMSPNTEYDVMDHSHFPDKTIMTSQRCRLITMKLLSFLMLTKDDTRKATIADF
jgi:hypothetical protein